MFRNLFLDVQFARHTKHSPIQLSPLSLPSFLIQNLSVDLIMDLPLVNGFDSIMAMINHGNSKGVILTPCFKTVDTVGIAKLFLKNVFK